MEGDLSLKQIPNNQIVEFILDEYEKYPIPEPLTFEQAEKQAVQQGLTQFLISPQGQTFLTSRYTQHHVPGRKLKTENSTRDHWTFLLLFWRFKRHWKKRERIETASVMEITDFLTKHYMNYWRNGVGELTAEEDIEDASVFSVIFTTANTPKNSSKIPIKSDAGREISRNYSEFITPPRLHLPRLSPPPVNKANRIMTDKMLAGLDASNYSPPTPSHLPRNRVRWEIPNDSKLDQIRPNYITNDTSMTQNDIPSGDLDKENYLLAPHKNGHKSADIA